MKVHADPKPPSAEEARGGDAPNEPSCSNQAPSSPPHHVKPPTDIHRALSTARGIAVCPRSFSRETKKNTIVYNCTYNSIQLMSAAEKGEIQYSGLELAIIQSLREGERATLSVLMISGSDGVSGDTRVDVHLKDGVLQWLTMPMSRLERMRRDSGGLAAVVMRAVRVWLVASPLISLVPRPTGPSTHSHLSGRSLNNESVPGSRFPSRECTDLRGCPTVRLPSSTARPIRSCNARTLPRAAYSRQSRTSYTCKVPFTSRVHPVYIPCTSRVHPLTVVSIALQS